MKVGDLVKLRAGPDWLEGIITPAKKKGVVVEVGHLSNGTSYRVRWMNGTWGWILEHDIEVISEGG